MIEEVLYPIVCKINEYLSSYILVFLLIGVGLWYSIRTRFVQVRCFGEAMKKTFGNIKLKGGAQKSGMTSFQALATAIAAQVGTGNIIGASGAILTGGPGAIFWMWVIAFFGMATIYAEATLAQKTRIIDKDGTVHGGPVYYITTAFKGGFGKFLAGFFAVAIILALGLMGSMVQSNSIGSTFQTAFGIPAWVMGIVLVIICSIIFLGGVQRLAAVTEKLVPIMAAIFLLGALVVLAVRIQYIPETFGMIFKYAFNPNAIIGGGIGLICRRLHDEGLRKYSTPEHFFNLGVFIVFALVGLVAWAFNPSFARMSGDFIYNLLTFNFADINSTTFVIHMLFGFFVLIWIPMTHMGHLLFKYFTYHDIRWGDTPTDFSQKNNEKMKQALQFKVSWAADHINGQGTKTWLDIATESPKKD